MKEQGDQEQTQEHVTPRRKDRMSRSSSVSKASGEVQPRGLYDSFSDDTHEEEVMTARLKEEYDADIQYMAVHGDTMGGESGEGKG